MNTKTYIRLITDLRKAEDQILQRHVEELAELKAKIDDANTCYIEANAKYKAGDRVWCNLNLAGRYSWEKAFIKDARVTAQGDIVYVLHKICKDDAMSVFKLSSGLYPFGAFPEARLRARK
jgi:hypothetical protein